MMAQAGWYPDPTTPNMLRYHDGTSWTHHVQPAAPSQQAPIHVQQVGQQVVASPNPDGAHAAYPAAQQPVGMTPAGLHAAPPQQVQVNQVVVSQGNRKSPGLAVLLAFLFGPLGMLYSTVPGAIVMFVLNLLFIWTFGIFYLISVPAGMIWAYIAANKTNEGSGIPAINVSQAPVAAPPQYMPQQPAQPQYMPQAQTDVPQLPEATPQQPRNPITEPLVVEPPRPSQPGTPTRPDGRPYGDW